MKLSSANKRMENTNELTDQSPEFKINEIDCSPYSKSPLKSHIQKLELTGESK